MARARVQVLIPVKAFSQAKARLAPMLGENARRSLARQMAERVIAAAAGQQTWVVCDDDEVADWARQSGVGVAWQPGVGLNGAVTRACAERFAQGAARVAVIHSDLPCVESLDWLDEHFDGVVVAPDRHDDGTNLLCTPTPEFRFSYGPGSFSKHLAEVTRLGLASRVVRIPSLGWDVDVPTDLIGLDRSTGVLAEVDLPMDQTTMPTGE